jgi:orotidine-5'-phosphate decarboxylase
MTSRIFVALDTPDLERAKAIAQRVHHHVGGIKLGLEFFMANGRAGVREMAELGLPIFLDLKFHDIPNTGTKVVAVTTLTSLDARDLASIGCPDDPHDQVLRLTELAMSAGVDGVVCSGAEVAAAKALWPKGFFVVPGVRPANGAAGDQKRVVTPRQALDSGASILVVGRPITQAEDPDTAAREIGATL